MLKHIYQPSRRTQKGATLVELMVGFIVALFIIAATGALFLLSARSSADLLSANRLNHTIQTSTDLMVSELRRAGFWNNQASGAPATNPFDTITIGTGCVLFAYDHLNDAGALVPDGQIQSAERTGFRRNGNALQVRTSGNTLTDCNDAGDTWVNLSDANTLQVTALSFTAENRCLNPISTPASVQNTACTGAFSAAPSGTELVELREIVITISASTDSNSDGTADATKSLTSRVKVRNNRLHIKP